MRKLEPRADTVSALIPPTQAGAVTAPGATRRRALRLLAWSVAALAGQVAGAGRACAKAITAAWGQFGGRIIARGDANYEQWRTSMTWYLKKPARYPDLMVQPRNVEEVLTAVHNARASGMRIAVRSTGHNPPGGCMREGGMLLDLSQLQAIEVERDAARAWVQPGRRSEEFAANLRPHGYAFPAAHTAFVGLGGYLLGGGLGWNWQAWDIACRSITAAKVITAAGDLVTIDAEREPDLFWALRGAGPGFPGAVVDIQVKLYPLPAGLLRSQYFIPATALDRVIPILEAMARDKHRDVELLTHIGGFPAPGTIPVPGHRYCVVHIFTFAADRDAATAMLAALPTPALAELAVFKREQVPFSFADLYRGGPTDHWSPWRTAVSNQWTDQPGAAVSALAELYARAPSPRSFILTGWGVKPRRDDADTLFSARADHYLSWYLLADEDRHVEPNRELMARAVDLTRRYARGRYVNEVDPVNFPSHVRDCFPGPKWERLRRVRKHYDPQHRFFDYLGSDREHA